MLLTYFLIFSRLIIWQKAPSEISWFANEIWTSQN